MLKISDIAKHVGVSATTVSLVLNESSKSSRFSEKTRNEILSAAEQLGYRSNRMARAMRTGNTRMLGILGGLPAEEHVGKMLGGALETADEQGYTLKLLRLHVIGNTVQQAIRNISELRLMGILALHLPDEVLEDLYTEAVKCETPLVLMDTHSINPDIPQVTSDDNHGFVLGVEHLVKAGHSKIAMIGGGADTTIGVSRRNAFKSAMARHGLTLNAKYYREGSYHEPEPSIAAARSLLGMPESTRPTAIFCVSDLMALATLKVAQELHIHLPSELSVIGFSNMRAATFASPALTTIEQPFEDIGRTAVKTLLNIINKPDGWQQAAETNNSDQEWNLSNGSKASNVKLLPVRLIERDSVAPPKN